MKFEHLVHNNIYSGHYSITGLQHTCKLADIYTKYEASTK